MLDLNLEPWNSNQNHINLIKSSRRQLLLVCGLTLTLKRTFGKTFYCSHVRIYSPLSMLLRVYCGWTNLTSRESTIHKCVIFIIYCDANLAASYDSYLSKSHQSFPCHNLLDSWSYRSSMVEQNRRTNKSAMQFKISRRSVENKNTSPHMHQAAQASRNPSACSRV